MKQGSKTLELIPIAVNLAAVAGASDDDWLSNDADHLIDGGAVQPKADGGPLPADAVNYQCDSLLIRPTSDGFALTTADGEVDLYSGAIVRIADQCYQVMIEQQAEAENTIAQPVMFMADDIWGGDDEHVVTNSHVADPFARQSQQSNLATAQANMAAAPVLSHQQDPLSFLYDTHSTATHDPNALLPSAPTQSSMVTNPTLSTPNYFAEPEHNGNREPATIPNQGNVLDTLGITATHTDIIPKHAGANVPLSEQAPIDRLDEYLSADDDIYSAGNMAAAPISTEKKPGGVKRMLKGALSTLV